MRFTIYSKPGCPYCEKCKAILEYQNFEITIYTLGVDFDKEQFYKEFGEGSTFPQIIMNDKLLGGCTDTIKYLQENNLCCNV